MIDIESQGDVALVRMRHGKANTLDIEFCAEVAARLSNAAGEARAIVLTADGPIFSAGVDLRRLVDGGPVYAIEFIRRLNEFCEVVFSLPVPLVVAVNGHAIAGGCVITCMADHRVMARGVGRIGTPELRVGVPFPPGPLEVMRFALPSRSLAEVLYQGNTYDADDALERGLVDEVVEPGELVDRAVEIATLLAKHSPRAFALTKQLVRAPYLARMALTATAVGKDIEAFWGAPETLAHASDYVERTLKKKE
jgi:enoyl-CoA hydratase